MSALADVEATAVAAPDWTPRRVLLALRQYVADHERVPAALDLNPSAARRAGKPERAERFERGAYPSLAIVARLFGGLSEALELAGLPANKAGRPRADAVFVAVSLDDFPLPDSTVRMLDGEADAPPAPTPVRRTRRDGPPPAARRGARRPEVADTERAALAWLRTIGRGARASEIAALSRRPPADIDRALRALRDHGLAAPWGWMATGEQRSAAGRQLGELGVASTCVIARIWGCDSDAALARLLSLEAAGRAAPALWAPAG